MKVFSLKKFEEYSTRSIEISKTLWANECEGLTKEAMNEKGICCNDDWMVEKDDHSTITLKEFWDRKDCLAIHCWNEIQAKVLLNKFDEMGKKWNSGDSYKDFTYFEYYKEKTCYLNNYYYGDITYRKDTGTKIYEFKDIEDFKGIYAADGTPLGSENKHQREKEPILDEVEKKYLSAVIKPFIDRIEYISKLEGKKGYFIYIKVKDDCDIILPDFNRISSMYKGMELGKSYTIEKLLL